MWSLVVDLIRADDSSEDTVGSRLAQQLGVSRDVEVTIPLGLKPQGPKKLTVSQQRNIRRQDYLNQVKKRNDVPLFTGLALLLVLPPACILGVAVAIGYVDILP